MYNSKPQNQMCDWTKTLQKSWLKLFYMTHTFDSGGFFTFLVALAHGAPLILGAVTVVMVQETRSKRISLSCMWCGNGKCKSTIFNISWGRKSFWSWLLWSGQVRAGYSRLQIEPLKVGRDATYFTFDLTQHSVRRFTPLVSAGITTQCTIWRKKLFVFR